MAALVIISCCGGENERLGHTVTEAAKDDSRTADLELLCHSLSSTISSVTDNTSQCRRPGRRRLPF
jgi:hypothetical protein